jgi:hypothetical protein
LHHFNLVIEIKLRGEKEQLKEQNITSTQNSTEISQGYKFTLANSHQFSTLQSTNKRNHSMNENPMRISDQQKKLNVKVHYNN